jgi:hypothetical protein
LNKNNLSTKELGLSLPLVEQFYTLQGEGFHTGKAAYFIRIGGCDLVPVVRFENIVEPRDTPNGCH